MIRLGNWNDLDIVRFTDHGAYLDGGDVGEILMPKAYVLDEMRPGDRVSVFVYLDQEERLVATTETPLARVGDFAFLRVTWVNEYGAFMDWGLMKDLFVPFREQKVRMQTGHSYLVHIHIDERTHRIVGSAKLDRWLRPAAPETYRRGSSAEIIIQQKTPLGLKVIVDNAYSGLVYDNQIFDTPPRTGDRLTGTIVNVRPDGKLDVSLQSLGTDRFTDFAERLLEELHECGVSKKTFKRAVGSLYKEKKIRLTEEGIRLNHHES